MEFKSVPFNLVDGRKTKPFTTPVRTYETFSYGTANAPLSQFHQPIEAQNAPNQFICVVCSKFFPDSSKLSRHLKQSKCRTIIASDTTASSNVLNKLESLTVESFLKVPCVCCGSFFENEQRALQHFSRSSCKSMYKTLVQKTKLERKINYNQQYARNCCSSTLSKYRKNVVAAKNERYYIKTRVQRNEFYKEVQSPIRKRQYHDSLKEKKRILYKTSLAQKLRKKYTNLLARKMKSHYTDVLREKVAVKYKEKLREPLRLQYQTTLKGPLHDKYISVLKEPLADKYVTKLKEPLHEKYLTKLREPLREKYLKVLKEPMRKKYETNLKEPMRKKYVTNLKEPMRKKYVTNLKEPMRKKYVTILKEPMRKKYVTILKEPMRKKYVTILKEPMRKKYVTNLKEPMRKKYVTNLKEPLRDKYVEVLKEPLREKYVEVLKEPLQEKHWLKKNSFTFDKALEAFRKSMRMGLTYICICCERLLFEDGVAPLPIKTLERLDNSLLKNCVPNFDSQASISFCFSCVGHLKKNQMPPMSALNDLQVEPMPPELVLTEFEQQLIAKNLLFMKIFQLPKSRMSAIKDKVINVPLTDTDLQTTTNLLPRSSDEAYLVNVQLKRSTELKNVYSQSLIRPLVLVKALEYLKNEGNAHYRDVVLNTEFANNDECDSTSESIADETEPAFDTCFVPQNPVGELIANKSLMSKVHSDTIVVAPGENKLPTNWLADNDFESKSFPCYFPSGKNTLSAKRQQKITTQQYFTQRIMNSDVRFASDNAYLFAAQQRVEREQLEKQCNLFFRRGKTQRINDKSVTVTQSDVQAVFQRIRGTSQYWRLARSEILAKVKQLGPFHFFHFVLCRVSMARSAGYYLSFKRT